MSSPRQEHLLDRLHQVAQGMLVPTDLAAEFGPEGEARARQVEALAGLGRLDVPADLAGRVVAATHGGHRQGRLVEQIVALHDRVAPAHLDDLVRHELERPFREVAPAPARNSSLTAPAELDDRVRRVLADVGPQTRPRPTHFAPTLMSVLALAVLIGFALRFGPVQASGEAGAAEGAAAVASSMPSLDALSFVVEPASSNPAASNDLRRALSALAGGAFEGSQR